MQESWLAKGIDEFAPEQELIYAELDLRLGNTEDSERRYRSLTGEAHPARVRSLAEAGLAQVAALRSKPELAVEHLERAASLGPLDDAGLETLGRSYAHIGREAEAIAVFRRRFEQAVTDEDSPAIVRFGVVLANALIDDVDFGEATRVLSFVIQAFDQTNDNAMARVRWSLARLHSLRGQTESARREAIAALSLLEASIGSSSRARIICSHSSRSTPAIPKLRSRSARRVGSSSGPRRRITTTRCTSSTGPARSSSSTGSRRRRRSR